MHDSSATGSRSYDSSPYRGLPIRQTHPSVLSAIARLLGIPAVDPKRCRCLELGCCDGGNIIPMAIEFPDSRFVGVDYSKVQIETGDKVVRKLGLTNLELRPMSILDITPNWGKFDYIISHGVFSWVPREVQDKLLAVCRDNLSPDGIAYISFNANPGWRMRGIARDLMRYRALRFDDPQQRIREARSILDFVAQNAWGTYRESYRGFLRTENELIKEMADFVLHHEHFEDHCEAFYFHEFIERAGKFDLDFIADARPGPYTAFDLSPQARQELPAFASNQIELEQLLDFVGNRTFRETLLHHRGTEPVRSSDPTKLAGLYLASKARPQNPAVDIGPGVPLCFETAGRSGVTISSPMLKAALVLLANEFPVSIQFESLCDRVLELLTDNHLPLDIPGPPPLGLGAALPGLIAHGIIEIESLPRAITTHPGARPTASPLTLLLAETENVFGTFGDNAAALNDRDISILKLLDGSRTTTDLAAALNTPLPAMEEIIRNLARIGLLIA